MNDPIVKEIRDIRDRHSAKFDYDIENISLDYQKKHEEFIKKLERVKVKSKM